MNGFEKTLYVCTLDKNCGGASVRVDSSQRELAVSNGDGGVELQHMFDCVVGSPTKRAFVVSEDNDRRVAAAENGPLGKRVPDGSSERCYVLFMSI